MPGKKKNIIHQLRPLQRSLFSLAAAVAVFMLLPSGMPVLMRVVISWAAMSITYLALCYYVIATMDVADIRQRAGEEDGNRVFVLAIIVIAALGSFSGIFSLIINKDISYPRLLVVGLSVGVMALSWLLVHTVFIFHYAYLYYKNGKGEGLDFPGDAPPDYWDFAYFSFCLGCTFQVSDVEVNQQHLHKVILLHSLVSFALNTFVVALTINILAGLSQ